MPMLDDLNSFSEGKYNIAKQTKKSNKFYFIYFTYLVEAKILFSASLSRRSAYKIK